MHFFLNINLLKIFFEYLQHCLDYDIVFFLIISTHLNQMKIKIMKALPVNQLNTIILLLATIMQACTNTPIKKPDQWPLAKNAIQIEILADKNLNIYEGTPHAVPICFYQLFHPDFYNKLASYPEGFNRLLECRSFHPSVARIHRVTIQPNEKKSIVMNREKDVRHVAVTAGYFFKDKNKISRIIDIPVRAVRPALIKSTEIVRPAPLEIRLRLGPEKIE
jgi:type VI secretion system VasD/TssJ family lipoprotein